MKKYYLDTEFLEGTQKLSFWRNTVPTIDLISIGLIDEHNRCYYAVSKEFNLKEAWNRWQPRTGQGDRNNTDTREYWIRENVLFPIFKDLKEKHVETLNKMSRLGIGGSAADVWGFEYKNLKYLIQQYGRSRADIANDICAFILGDDCGGSGMSAIEMARKYELSDRSKKPSFYAYFSSYDWVVFCWLYNKMNDLPKDFPKFPIDLKVMFDDLAKDFATRHQLTIKQASEHLKSCPHYPTQDNAHNAMDDAKWNRNLHDFIIIERERLK